MYIIRLWISKSTFTIAITLKVMKNLRIHLVLNSKINIIESEITLKTMSLLIGDFLTHNLIHSKVLLRRDKI